MIRFNKKKTSSFILATSLFLALIVVATFAWSSISQIAEGKFEGQVHPGARLHDDFNGSNKDIYVENYADTHNGVNVFARIQLREYMEIGSDAGKYGTTYDQSNRNVEVIGKQDASIQDVSSWHIYKLNPTSQEDVTINDAFRKFWTWQMGNNKDSYYMPTFNKDNLNEDSDRNGTLDGLDGDRDQGTPYDDYRQWNANDTLTKKEILNGGQESEEEVIHTAQKVTHHAQVITMQEWKDKGQPLGPYWVYDSDGWAYWAQPIPPGETTGFLLDGISMVGSVPELDYYYAIQAIGQFATAEDWPVEFAQDITEDGKKLLDIVANRLPKVTYILPKYGDDQVAVPERDLVLEADVYVENGTKDPKEKELEWTINDETVKDTLQGNVFRPTREMAGKTYYITATSKFTPSVTRTIAVRVLSEGTQIVEGADKERYVDFGSNVYKKIGIGGNLSNFVCAGSDQIIGNDNDIKNVYDILSDLTQVDAQYGRFFLPISSNRYYAVGDDGLLGTTDDRVVTSTSNNWPYNLAEATN